MKLYRSVHVFDIIILYQICNRNTNLPDDNYYFRLSQSNLNNLIKEKRTAIKNLLVNNFVPVCIGAFFAHTSTFVEIRTRPISYSNKKVFINSIQCAQCHEQVANLLFIYTQPHFASRCDDFAENVTGTLRSISYQHFSGDVAYLPVLTQALLNDDSSTFTYDDGVETDKTLQISFA